MPSYSNKTRIIFLDLPNEIQERVDSIRRIHNPDAVKRGIAHITFKQDEDYLIENEKIIEIVESQRISPFVLKMDGIKIRYDNEHFVIFVSFEEHPGLNNAIATLSKNLEPFIDSEAPDALSSTHWEQSNDFFPHITIVSRKDENNEGKELYKEITSMGFDPKEIIRCTSLRLCEWEKNHWKTIHRINLNDSL